MVSGVNTVSSCHGEPAHSPIIHDEFTYLIVSDRILQYCFIRSASGKAESSMILFIV